MRGSRGARRANRPGSAAIAGHSLGLAAEGEMVQAMEIRQLRYLVVASKTRNFSQAADRCFTSRQNLTVAIRELESELGADFFKTVGNKPVLTPEGKSAADKAEQILRGVDELEEMFCASSPARALRELKVLCPIYMRLANDNVFNALKGFDAFHLQLDEQMPDACYEKVCHGKADAALVYVLTRDFPLCESVFLGSAPIRVLVSAESPLALASRVNMADLAHYDTLLLPNRDFVYQRFIEAYRDCGLSEKRVHTMVDYSLMTEQVLQGSSVALAAKTFPKELPDGIASVPFENIGCDWSLYFLFRKDAGKQGELSELLTYLERDPRVASLAARS